MPLLCLSPGVIVIRNIGLTKRGDEVAPAFIERPGGAMRRAGEGREPSLGSYP